MVFDNKQIRLILILLGVATASVAVIYLVFFRSPMVPVYQNIRESDASAIVAELDHAGIPYRLENAGHDILVPDDQAAQARVLIAGSNVAIGGTVGFELFNNSDMGLTEFAQKINFQRAMQGELARTIMSMEGVEFARVHLALPERSVFRSEQGEPTAAVTLQMTPGTPLTRQRIEGVRQLVASSVPDLSPAAVVILDDKGDLVSGTPTLDNGYGGALTERSALEQYYQTLARQAVHRVLPGKRFEVTVNARRTLAADGAPSGNELDTPDRRDLVLSVLVRTQDELAPEDREAIESTVADTLHLDRAGGDALTFSVGLENAEAAASLPPIASPEAPSSMTPEAQRVEWTRLLFTRWTLFALAILALLVLVVRPRRRLDDQEAEEFGELLKNASFNDELADAG